MAAHSDPFVLTQRFGRPAGPGGSYGGWAMEGFNWTIFALALAMATLLPAARGKVTMSLSILIFGVATALAPRRRPDVLYADCGYDHERPRLPRIGGTA